MADDSRLAYVQARLQARHGDRPGPDDWRVVEASADLAHYLEALKRTGMHRWSAGLSPDATPEALEREFREAWLACVDEVAGWMDKDWKQAVDWLRWLPYLPAIEHLLGPRRVPPWMRSDPVMRPLAFDDPARRRQALSSLPFAALDPGEEGSRGLVDAWLEAWRGKLPAHADDERVALERLVSLVTAHLEAMRQDIGSGSGARLALRERLVRSTRRSAGRMAAVFAHLCISGLDLERARAGVMARRLMPRRPEGRSWA